MLAAMACCGSRPKGKALNGKMTGGASGRIGGQEARGMSQHTQGPLIFATQHGELRFDEEGALVVREESADADSPKNGGASPKSPKDAPAGSGSKLGAKRARPGSPGGAGNRYRMASCNGEDDRMHSGMHFAEFTLVKAAGNLTLGVVQLDYSPTRALPPGEPRGLAGEGWGLSTRSGSLTFRGRVSEWSGVRPCAEGDRVGMLVDLSKGSLSVFLNNVHLGFMVKAVRF